MGLFGLEAFNTLSKTKEKEKTPGAYCWFFAIGATIRKGPKKVSRVPFARLQPIANDYLSTKADVSGK